MTDAQNALRRLLESAARYERLGGASWHVADEMDGAAIVTLGASGKRSHRFEMKARDLLMAVPSLFDRVLLEVGVFEMINRPAPDAGAVVFSGPMHVHFNRHGAAPLVWSVAPADGRWEVAVKRVVLDGVPMTSTYKPKATPDDEDGKPSAWFEVDGRLELGADGTATIRKP